MIRTIALCGALLTGSMTSIDSVRLEASAPSGQASAGQGQPAAGQTPTATPAAAGQAASNGAVTPAQAAPFLGDWTLALQGPNGPGAFDLTVKVEENKVVGQIGAPTMPAQAITDVSLVDNSLALRYTFPYEGNPIDAAVWLTPGADGRVAAQIDFAGGAYVMSGTATKKAPAAAPR